MSAIELPNGVTLSYAEQGPSSSSAVIFVPGPTDSARSYAGVLAAMDPALRCVALSPRGHGDSDKPAAGYDVRTFAADLVHFLTAHGIGRAVLVGHSGSCPTVRLAALTRPDLVAALVLEASPTTLSGHPGLVDLLEVVRTLEDPIDPDFVRGFVADTSSETIPSSEMDAFVAEAGKVPARAWKAMFEDLLVYDDAARLHEIASPVLLVWGDADPLISRSMQDELLARLPSAEIVVYEGVGHTPRWEQPERFAADVTAFANEQLS